MKTIAIDIDDVLSPFTESFIDYYNSKYGASVTLSDFLSPGEYWGFYENVLARLFDDNDNIQEYRRRFIEYLDTDSHASGQTVYDSARTAISNLNKHYDLHIVTARDESIKKRTTDWINKEFPDVFSAVHFSTWKNKEKKSKLDICEEIGADYIIDDSVEHCNAVASSGRGAVLFGEYGWSSVGETHKNVIRLPDWESVSSYFLQNKC